MSAYSCSFHKLCYPSQFSMASKLRFKLYIRFHLKAPIEARQKPVPPAAHRQPTDRSELRKISSTALLPSWEKNTGKWATSVLLHSLFQGGEAQEIMLWNVLPFALWLFLAGAVMWLERSEFDWLPELPKSCFSESLVVYLMILWGNEDLELSNLPSFWHQICLFVFYLF